MLRLLAADVLAETIGASPIANVITNPRRAENPIEVANAAFCALTGYSETEILAATAVSWPVNRPSRGSPNRFAVRSMPGGRCWSTSSITAATARLFATA